MMGHSDWEEGIALGFLREIGEPEPPIDAFLLAFAAGIEIRFGGRARRVGDAIWLPRNATPLRQQWIVAHELGHWLLDRAGELQSEHGADIIGCALLAPRHELVRLIGDGLTLAEIAARFPACPEPLVTARAGALRPLTSSWA